MQKMIQEVRALIDQRFGNMTPRDQIIEISAILGKSVPDKISDAGDEWLARLRRLELEFKTVMEIIYE